MVMRLLILVLAVIAAAVPAAAQQTFKIDVTGGVREPLPFAAPVFVAETSAANAVANDMTSVVREDLLSTGLFREIPQNAHISVVGNFASLPAFADWQAINAQALVIGSVSVDASGNMQVRFRLWDVFAQAELGEGRQYSATTGAWRRIAHKISDEVYSRLTGEGGYFDSRVAFVSESGPKNARVKRLAIMDQDGANVRFLTDGRSLVLAPRFSPNAREVIYTSYASGAPQVRRLNVDTLQETAFAQISGMTFAPRFSPDGRSVVLSATSGANTDIFLVDIAGGSQRRLTENPAIDTAPSFSPDGRQIVFESDRGGSQQLYVMPSSGGEARRVSFGKGRYATPVWSPRGDLIAFTKMQGGRFHIGVMRSDGSQERLLTASFLDEGPTWAPNGRVLTFFREPPGEKSVPGLYSIDVSGQNLRRIRTPEGASDPAWSGQLE